MVETIGIYPVIFNVKISSVNNYINNTKKASKFSVIKYITLLISDTFKCDFPIKKSLKENNKLNSTIFIHDSLGSLSKVHQGVHTSH